MNEKALIALKSTLDKVVKDMADAADLEFLSLDGEELEIVLANSDTRCLAWGLTSFSPSPVDPLYLVDFAVGSKTSRDPGEYAGIDINSKVAGQFSVGSDIPVYDYSGTAAPTEKLGYLVITAVTLAPQEFDKTVKVRLTMITARAVVRSP